jgi:hypothetical protein
MKRALTAITMSARTVLGVFIGTALAGSAGQSALAKTLYDGKWSVAIVTERGTCDRSYRYPVSIVNGVVERSTEGDQSFAVSGKVTGTGTLHVVVARGRQRAEGSGRLSHIDGQGKWVSGTGECVGYWTAERRQ